jgi:hypothetical protein
VWLGEHWGMGEVVCVVPVPGAVQQPARRVCSSQAPPTIGTSDCHTQQRGGKQLSLSCDCYTTWRLRIPINHASYPDCPCLLSHYLVGPCPLVACQYCYLLLTHHCLLSAMPCILWHTRHLA